MLLQLAICIAIWAVQEEACWDKVIQEAHNLVPPSQDGDCGSQAPVLARDGYLGALQQAQDSTQRRVCLQVGR